MTVAGQITEDVITMPRGTPTVIDGYLDDIGENHLEAREAFRDAETLRMRSLLRLSHLAVECPQAMSTLRTVAELLNKMAEPLHVACVSLDQAGVHANEVRECPAVKRARREARKGNEERRSRMRREADRHRGARRVRDAVADYQAQVVAL